MKIGKFRIYIHRFDWFLPLIIFVYTINYYMETLSLPHPEAHNLLIRPVAYAIILLTVIYFLSHLRWEPAGERLNKEPPRARRPLAQVFRENRRFLLFMLSTGIYLPLISLLGFPLASALYMAASMYHLGVRNRKLLVLLPLATVTGIVLMFEGWLSISVPKGIFGF